MNTDTVSFSFHLQKCSLRVSYSARCQGCTQEHILIYLQGAYSLVGGGWKGQTNRRGRVERTDKPILQKVFNAMKERLNAKEAEDGPSRSNAHQVFILF